jgi:hypothetical protein
VSHWPLFSFPEAINVQKSTRRENEEEGWEVAGSTDPARLYDPSLLPVLKYHKT